jgi:hypothetical protein
MDIVKSHKFFSLLALIFGFLGVVLCMAAILAVSSFTARLHRTNEMVFEKVDATLVAVQTRIESAQEAVETAKINTEEVRQGLNELAREEVGERVASRLQLAERTEKLGRGLEQADAWLEVSDESMRSVQQILEMGRSLGAPLDVEMVDPLMEKIQLLRDRMKNTTEFVDDIHQTVVGLKDDESGQQRTKKALELLLRVVATLTEVDSRLDESAGRFAEIQSGGKQLQARTNWYILLSKLASYLLIGWMAVGQVFMCRYGAKLWGQKASTPARPQP